MITMLLYPHLPSSILQESFQRLWSQVWDVFMSLACSTVVLLELAAWPGLWVYSERQAIQKLRSHFSVCWPQFLLPLPICLWFGICRHTTAVQLINWHTLGGPHLLRFYNCCLLHQTWIEVFQTLPQRLSWYSGVKFRTRIWSRHFIPNSTCFPTLLLSFS